MGDPLAIVDRLMAAAQLHVGQALTAVELAQHAGLSPVDAAAGIAASVAMGRLVGQGKTYRRPIRGDTLPTVGQVVEYVRRLRGLKQADAARRAGMHQPAWSRLARGRARPRIDTLDRIARALDVRTQDLAPG